MWNNCYIRTIYFQLFKIKMTFLQGNPFNLPNGERSKMLSLEPPGEYMCSRFLIDPAISIRDGRPERFDRLMKVKERPVSRVGEQNEPVSTCQAFSRLHTHKELRLAKSRSRPSDPAKDAPLPPSARRNKSAASDRSCLESTTVGARGGGGGGGGYRERKTGKDWREGLKEKERERERRESRKAERTLSPSR